MEFLEGYGWRDLMGMRNDHMGHGDKTSRDALRAH